ncbi:beta-galactosidase trimerization domain-containing protein [Dactylosporangium sp. NPDC005572]|uniref:beta-galactosidase trimerization domain-containing protein n=1 Tax=Dactylosporangium sp. NPDC005572 TaxID=3156889 RepID=UPI00339E0C5D
MKYHIDNGRLTRDGAPFTPLGVTYWPAAAGCELWRDWAPKAVEDDFAAIAATGLNTVRLFLFWRDAEPDEGGLDPVVLDRVRWAVDAAGRHGLACVLSLVTIWMNGQRLEPPWRRGRSLWRDPDLLAAQARYAGAVAGALAGADALLLVDLGDEIGNVDPAEAAGLTAGEVERWRRTLADAVRAAAPGTLVCQANDASAVFGPSAFDVRRTGGLDVTAVHAFPTWSPGSVESTRAVKASHLAAFAAWYASAWRPSLVDELGSYGTDEAVATGHLAASTASCLAGGGLGAIYWCWQDVASTAEPYDARPMERFAGLSDVDGVPKPRMAAVRRLARHAAALRPAPGRARVALFAGGPPPSGGAASYLDPAGPALATFYAYLLLKRAHLRCDLVTGDLTGYDVVICPSVQQVTAADLDRLHAVVRVGGTVWFTLDDHLHGFPGAALAGAELVDFARAEGGPREFAWAGVTWPVRVPAGELLAEVRPTTAEVLATFADGAPALLRNRVGAGTVYFSPLPLERLLDHPHRLDAAPWHAWYATVAAGAGVVPDVSCDDPDVELVALAEPPGAVLAVNHRATPADTELRRPSGATRRVALPGKDWAIVDVEG